ncbi:MAG: enoyl-CoA hydratase [Parvibaculaceae bacterium]|nr:enoyl-CoA hydratase [Parvibaculaceae bacterium]
MTDLVLAETAHGVHTLTINRPDKKNALTEAMYAALADGIAHAESDPAVRVTRIRGTGGSFTAGNDLADFAAQGAKPVSTGDSKVEAPVTRFLRAVSTTEKPLVAQVNGLAVGVGVTMLLHCDLVYAGESATFQAPFVNLGLVPEAASSLLLPRLVGLQRAGELFLLGRKIGSAEARDMGLVAQVLPDDALDAGVEAVARELAAKAPNAVRFTKGLLRKNHGEIAERMAEEGRIFAAQLRSAEVKEAIGAFFEKRPADFSKL